MALRIKLFKIEDLDKNLKATVHRTGKMGFTADASKKLKLSESKSADIGKNEDDVSDKNFYLFIHKEPKTGEFNIVKAGDYYYINTKVLFDNLKMDYTKDNFTYDISPETIDGQEVFVLKRRVKALKTTDDFGQS